MPTIKTVKFSAIALAMTLLSAPAFGAEPATRPVPAAPQPAQAATNPFIFREVSREMGLYPAIKGVRAHAGVLGDYNGDGWIDFFVGTFQTEDSAPSVLFRNDQGKKFVVDDSQPMLLRPGRTTGGMFVDLDNDGDNDFYVANNSSTGGSGKGETLNYLYRNDGNGKFTDLSAESSACPPYATRNVVPIDFDGDGLLDILLGGGRYKEQGRPGGRLLHNLGNLKFEDASERMPEDAGAMTCVSVDVNNDTYPDLFYVSRLGYLLLNDGKGHFTPAKAANETFIAARSKVANQAPAGACFVDLNRDGLLDVVIGQNTGRPWIEPISPRLFLNRGIQDGQPMFEDVTEQAGLVPVPLKTPQIEIHDFDNDGWPDIYCATFKFADGKVYPVIFHNLGVKDGMVHFEQYALGVNDFPTAEDRNLKGSSTVFYNKMIKDRKCVYAVAAPAGDYDHDGRIDIFCAEWWAENPSFLLHNETPAGNWLVISVNNAASTGVNRMGIGSKVRIYEPGKLGQPAALLGCQDINIGYGFSSSQEPIAHFGLGKLTECDVEVILPFNKGTIKKEHVKANQRLMLP